ncbi:MAG: hypothetical protein FWD33_03415 [Alphaproteobacteria bacterium]|nr:hypothetical protein [Alphaproteobacteria bacterium]
MKKQFELWLESKGYSYFTPEGRPSTIYDYVNRGLKRVCREEHLSLLEVAKRVDRLLPAYQYGKKSEIGKSISRSCRSSLAAFSKFVKEQGIA